MKIGLIDIDSRIPNLALMKISAWHKAAGDEVKFFDPLFDHPEKIYMSKIFNYTPGFYEPIPCDCVQGGTGFDLETVLPAEIEGQYPDYELYGCDYAIGFTTRGCIRNCPFCVVPQKEGRIRAVAELKDFWRGQDKVMLLDNNLTALPAHFEKILFQLIQAKVKVDFSQGLDIRLIMPEMARALAEVRLWKQIHFAWDRIGDEAAVCRGIEILINNGVVKSRLMFYILIGFDSTQEEDLYRVNTLRGLGIDSFVMPYNRANPYQADFSRWVNHKAIFKSIPWIQYKHGRYADVPLKEASLNERN